MANYEVRLYKQAEHNPNKYNLVYRISIKAESDEEAKTKARHVEVPTWENSDLALLFTEDCNTIWRLEG
jgi:hypothetical protein